MWPAVSKSANLCPGLHQLGGSRRPGFCLYDLDSRFLDVSGAVKKSGHMSIWATVGRARGVASVMARLGGARFSRGRKKIGNWIEKEWVAWGRLQRGRKGRWKKRIVVGWAVEGRRRESGVNNGSMA